MLASAVFYSMFFLVVVIMPAVAILLVLLLLDHRQGIWTRTAHLVRATCEMLPPSPALARVLARYPRTISFVERRVDSRPWGLRASLATIGALAGMWLFLGLLQDIIAKDPLVALDLRIHNIVPLFRTDQMTWVMLGVTQLGSAPVLAALCLGIALVAIGSDRPRLAAAFVVAPASAGLLSSTLKVLIGHARPLDSLVHSSTASFPSGHLLGAAVVYGLLAAILLRSERPIALRVAGTTLLLLLIVAVGISRLYLGVHWPSDLLASLAVALGLLSALLFALQFDGRAAKLDAYRLSSSGARAARGVGIGIALAALILAAYLAPRTKETRIDPPAPRHPLDLSTFLKGLPPELPRFSEDLVGGKMEPISLIFIGSRASLDSTLAKAGWSPADRPTPVRIAKVVINVLAHRPDATAPVTPAFFSEWPQTIAFQRPDSGHPDISRRHHTRVWQTPYCIAPDCRPVWVATASFDEGMEISARLRLPTHRINPSIDNERALITSELSGVGAAHAGNATVTPAMRGSNAAGDPFETDGRAAILILPNPP